MAERWGYKDTEYTRNYVRGQAIVKKLKSGGFRVTLKEHEQNQNGVITKIPEQVYDVSPDNVMGQVVPGTWNVTLSEDGSILYGVVPWAGMYKAKFVKFSCPEGQIPAPIHKTRTFRDRKTGKEGVQEFDAMTAILEIVDGEKTKGMNIPYSLRYYFGEWEGEVRFIKPKSQYTDALIDFCDVFGVFEKGPMAFSENLLPALEARILEQDKIAVVSMKNGFIDTLAPSEMPEDESADEEVDDTKASEEEAE